MFVDYYKLSAGRMRQSYKRLSLFNFHTLRPVILLFSLLGLFVYCKFGCTDQPSCWHLSLALS